MPQSIRLCCLASVVMAILSLALPADAQAGPAGAAAWRGGPGYRTFVIGDEQAARPDPLGGGLLLSGGGNWPYEAFHWFMAHAGHGHIVVLRASGKAQVQEALYRKVGGALSVRTFLFKDRRASSDERLLASLRAADGIFIAGGDQANYVRMWRGTPVAEALDAHVRAGKPLGGTSAGLAMLGAWMYGATDGGSIGSPQALADPLGPHVALETDLVHLDLLAHVLTDTHFDTRQRLGRLMAFLAKAHALEPGRPLAGLGVDEQTVLVVEPDGKARLHANGAAKRAWWVQPTVAPAAVAGHPLDWRGLRVTGIDAGSVLDLATGEVDRPAFRRIYDVVDGVLQQRPGWSLAIHGGAGVLERGEMDPAREAAYRTGLAAALDAGRAVLERGGTSLDAVQAAVEVMEDDPLFNAGRGAAIAADGQVYLDAAVMEGVTGKAGAVAALTRTRHPVLAARAVMDHTRHVFLAGPGADQFAIEQGLEQVDPSWFHTPQREQMFREWQLHGEVLSNREHRYGTVGAVALDQEGHLAAATSTGGLTGKRWGRIGDSPIIGAGTYARDGQCAVSATGTGEYFIREGAGRQVCDRMRWAGQDVHRAARDTIAAIGAIGGDGALVAMDPSGAVEFAINDLGMYRGLATQSRPEPRTAIYPEEEPK